MIISWIWRHHLSSEFFRFRFELRVVAEQLVRNGRGFSSAAASAVILRRA